MESPWTAYAEGRLLPGSAAFSGFEKGVGFGRGESGIPVAKSIEIQLPGLGYVNFSKSLKVAGKFWKSNFPTKAARKNQVKNGHKTVIFIIQYLRNQGGYGMIQENE